MIETVALLNLLMLAFFLPEVVGGVLLTMIGIASIVVILRNVWILVRPDV